MGALWVSETDAEGRPRVVEGTAVVFAGIESAAETPGGESPFERLLLRELSAAGCAPGDVEVCVGDGAEWIRRVVTDVTDPAILSRYGTSSRGHRKWTRECGHLDGLI